MVPHSKCRDSVMSASSRFALSCGALLLLAVGCSSSEQGVQSDTAISMVTATHSSPSGALADTLSRVCPSAGRRGSILVARVDPKVEEGGVAFDLLGDGAGPGVVLCRDVLYADGNALTALMGDSAKVIDSDGLASIDGALTRIPSYYHEGVLYVAVAPFARQRRAVLLPSPDHPMDATVWPRQALLHLKKSGLTQGRAYQAAVRDGLVPN
jgi:hypothetical protein